MRACVRDVFAIYDNNISPSLLMIIIKIIIIYKYISYKSDTLMIPPPTGSRVPLLVHIMQSIIILSSWLHNLGEDSSRQANWKAGCCGLHLTMRHYGCPTTTAAATTTTTTMMVNPRNVPDCFVQQFHAFNLSHNIPLLNLIKYRIFWC